MFLQKISVKYTSNLVRIYTNIHIPIDTYTLIIFMFKNIRFLPLTSCQNTYWIYIYIYILIAGEWKESYVLNINMIKV